MRISSDASLAAIYDIELKSDASISDIRRFETPPISALIREGDKTECYKLINAMIVLLNQYYGITWSDFQLKEVSKEFYSKYFYWHQLDLKKFFSMCKAMEFEKLLSVNQFSPMMFLSWAAAYDQKWMGVSEEMSLGNHRAMVYDDVQEKKRLDLEERNYRQKVQEKQYREKKKIEGEKDFKQVRDENKQLKDYIKQLESE